MKSILSPEFHIRYVFAVFKHARRVAYIHGRSERIKFECFYSLEFWKASAV